MENCHIAHALFDAIDSKDVETFKSLFTEDAVIWHNYDGSEQTPGDAATALAGPDSFIATMAHDERRYTPVPDGIVCQHVTKITTKQGHSFSTPAMLHIYTDGSRVSRIEEYFHRPSAG